MEFGLWAGGNGTSLISRSSRREWNSTAAHNRRHNSTGKEHNSPTLSLDSHLPLDSLEPATPLSPRLLIGPETGPAD